MTGTSHDDPRRFRRRRRLARANATGFSTGCGATAAAGAAAWLFLAFGTVGLVTGLRIAAAAHTRQYRRYLRMS